MIRYVLFDLDNTLYSPRIGLEDAVVLRINAFISTYFGVDQAEAARMRNAKRKAYGTTLEWLMAEHGLNDPEPYYAAVHPENEADDLEIDEAVDRFVRTLPVPASVLTNAPMEHANRILDRLGLHGVFEHIFDIRRNELKGKPQASAYERALSTIGRPVEDVLFVDDAPSYVDGYRDLGGLGVLIDEKGQHPSFPDPKIRTLPELARFLGVPS